MELSIDLEETEVGNIVEQYHRYIDQLLLFQQQALVARATELAVDFMALHRQMLAAHIEVEDQWLLSIPLADQQSWRWPASLYLAEHKKISSFLTREEQRLLSLAQQRPTAMQVIALLDSQRSYKNLLEHHEEREEIALLKEITPPQQELLQRQVSDRWQQLYRQQRQPLAELVQRLSELETSILKQ